MSKQTINIGASPNDGTGTPLRTSFDYTNQNFTELYTAVGPSGNNIVVPGNATITGDLTVDTSTLKVDSANNRVGIGTASPGNALHVQSSGDVARFTNGTNSAYLAIDSAGYTFFTGAGQTGNGIYAKASTNAVQLWTNGAQRYDIDSTGVATWSVAGTTAMTLNSTGLGIGVVPSTHDAGKGLEVGALGNGLWCNNSTFNQLLQNATYNGGWKYAAAASTAASRLEMGGGFSFHIAPAGTAPNAITFTQAMTLDASGNLLVGTTSVLNSARVSLKAASVATVLSLNGVTGDTAQESFVINKFDSNSTTSQVFARFTNGNGASGSGQINGNGANACAFGSFSDSRLKENILSLPSQLANILSLRPVEFDYKDGSGHQIGFVAQEMQEVYSDAVGEQNGFLTVTGWSKTEARLVSAIKELAAKVQALEAKLA